MIRFEPDLHYPQNLTAWRGDKIVGQVFAREHREIDGTPMHVHTVYIGWDPVIEACFATSLDDAREKIITGLVAHRLKS